MSMKLGQVTNSDVYFDGVNIAGRVSEFSIEDVGYETIEHKALGMIAIVELPARTLNPLKAKIKFDWLDEAIMRRTALPNRAVTMQFQSYVDVFDADGVNTALGYRLITSVDLMFASSAIDALQNGENSGDEIECTCLRLVVSSSRSSVPIREINVTENINRVDGADVWPTY